MHSTTHILTVSLDVRFINQAAAVLFSPHSVNIRDADRSVVVVVVVIVVVVDVEVVVV